MVRAVGVFPREAWAVTFVAIVLCCLGLLMVVGFAMLWAQLGALADEMRAARAADAHQLATQLDAVADKQQGMRLDLAALTKELQGQRQNLAALTFQLEGPPSMRRPTPPD